MKPDQVQRKAGSELGAPQQAAIGAKLRNMFDDLVNEPVPDHLMDLLAQLDAAEDDAEGPPESESDQSPESGDDEGQS
ncbi:MAG: NepR family anti-sigma factor [Alphaproteobacteria bacterium]